MPSAEPIRYLSLDWIEALTGAVADDPDLGRLAAEHVVGLTQVVEDGPEGTVTYHLQLDAAGARFGPGPAEPEDVRLTESWETAVAVATGALNAEQAFLGGRIRLMGNPTRVLELHPVLVALDAVFTRVAARTEYR